MYPNPNQNRNDPYYGNNQPMPGQPLYPVQGQAPYPTQGQPLYPGQGQPYPVQGQHYPAQQPYPPGPGFPYPPAQQTAYPPAPLGFSASAAPAYNSPYPPSGNIPQVPSYPSAVPSYSSAVPASNYYPNQSQYQPQAQQFGYPQQASVSIPSTNSPNLSPKAAPMQQYQDTPSIRPINADPSSDAQILRKAMKGFGTDEDAIINVLGKRTNEQRQQINKAFKVAFGKDLIKDLKSELGGKLEDVVLALMMPRYEYLAKRVNSAIRGIGTNEKALVDVICTSSNQEIQSINAVYYQLYKKTIEKDIIGDTGGHFRRLLVSMSMGGRSEDPYVNMQAARQDAETLYKAGEKKWGTDESAFNMILATKSYPQLRAMFHEYESVSGHSFEKAIKTEFSGDVELGFLAVVKCSRNRAAYFAERIHESIAGMGTKDNDLIFLIVSRADVDLENVKQEYQKMYGKSLLKDVKGDTGGDYQKMLSALIGE